MKTINRNADRDVIGCAPYVRVADGFLPLGPAIKPDSALRFYRGRPPANSPGEQTTLTVASAGATPMAASRLDRPRGSKGSAPAPYCTDPEVMP